MDNGWIPTSPEPPGEHTEMLPSSSLIDCDSLPEGCVHGKEHPPCDLGGCSVPVPSHWVKTAPYVIPLDCDPDSNTKDCPLGNPLVLNEIEVPHSVHEFALQEFRKASKGSLITSYIVNSYGLNAYVIVEPEGTIKTHNMTMDDALLLLLSATLEHAK